MTGHAPAVITGIGLVTPAGIGRAVNWRTVCAGQPTARRVPGLQPVSIASTVPDTFNADRLTGRRVTRLYDPATLYALVAARAALSDAGLSPAMRAEARVGVVVGTAFGGAQTWESNHARALNDGPEAINARFLPKGLVNMTSGILAIELGVTGPNMVVSTACASGASAVGLGLGLLRSNSVDVVLCGGTDASITSLHVGGFHKLRALSTTDTPEHASRPFDQNHDGFVMAEGAAILVLERETDVAARRARPYARVAGYAATADAHHVTAPHPKGLGAKTAIRLACEDAGIAPDDVHHANAHATSTPTGDAVEADVLRDVIPNASVTSTKGVTGHCMGAAGAIEAAYTAMAIRHNTAPPTANLVEPCDAAKDLDLVTGRARPQRINTAISTSFGFGGHNAVLALTR